ncbi:MAG: hypothetical protein EP330_15890 [Deltaproteobacteria bacterium]|nr:MAG: hypothetical protein EP330_15890 [Deltaproteobacteria bacterium]
MANDSTIDREGFGTFTGVVRPVALTILGAMLYLREGWLVGQAGVLGALFVIGLSVAITGTTAMSLASIASNVRVRPGGAFAIISQALGLEAGGAIGVPLYIAQAASSAMYVYAFTEAWAYLFPDHPAGWVAGIAYAALALLAWASSDLAFRAQGVLMWVIVAALVSGLLGIFRTPHLADPVLVGRFADTSPVGAFAIFFPAVTGIMVGAGMSGSLADPRRAIPRGTLIAWAGTSAIYALFAVWYGLMGTVDELVSNKTLIIDKALFPPLVICGLLVSTLMAALSSLVAAPRLLQAMAEQDILPGSRWLSTTHEGEPRNALLFTTVLGALGLAAGSLDAIAPIITSFFIMTYMAINAVVYVERVLGMISFRPSFPVPASVPLAGLALCGLGLAAGSPFGGLVELFAVIGIYGFIAQRQVETPWETVRSGIVVTVAAWTARRAAHIERSERAWKPDLLIPVSNADEAGRLRVLAESMARRNGSLRWVGIGAEEDLGGRLKKLARLETRDGVHAVSARLKTSDRTTGVALSLDALQAALFPPNMVLLDAKGLDDDELAAHLARCRELGVGLALWVGPEGPTHAYPVIDVWLSDRSPDWALEMHNTNLDLPVLAGFLLAESWDAQLRLRTVVRNAEHRRAGAAFLHSLRDQARIPAEVIAGTGSFDQALREAGGGLHLFGMPPEVSLERLRSIADTLDRPCLWLLDSGGESALA